MSEEEKNQGNPGQGGTIDASQAETVSPEELQKLRQQAAERDQYLDLVLRTKAEFENYQKRSQREREQERRYWNTEFAASLFPVLDNLERALGAAQEAGDTGSLAQGVAMVQAQFLEGLKRNGILRIDALHKPFDPNVHQAVMQQPTSEVEPGMVLRILEPGFMNQDRVLRPAKVIVSSRPV